MIKLYRTKNERVYEKLKRLLPEGSQIRNTENGKPYTDGVCFSITHTGDIALLATSDNPVGIDAEIIKNRNFSSVLKRFSKREQAEICTLTQFLEHWVVKEAYIKMIGGTLAHDLKRLEYVGGELLSDGIKTECNLLCASSGDLIFCICAQSEIPQDIKLEII